LHVFRVGHLIDEILSQLNAVRNFLGFEIVNLFWHARLAQPFVSIYFVQNCLRVIEILVNKFLQIIDKILGSDGLEFEKPQIRLNEI
jgi:hypothetical protein